MARAAEAGKAGSKRWRKATAYPLCTTGADPESACLRAMQNHARPRALTRGMFHKTMEGAMILRPHPQHPGSNHQRIESAPRNHHLQAPGPRVSRRCPLIEDQQEREQQPAGDSGEWMNQKDDAHPGKE